MRRHSELGTRNCEQRLFRKDENTKTKDEFLMTIMKLRLGFLVLDASEYVGIYCGLRTQFFYSWERGEYI